MKYNTNFTTGAQTQTIECIIWRYVKIINNSINYYRIKTRGATDLLDRQLNKEGWRSINP